MATNKGSNVPGRLRELAKKADAKVGWAISQEPTWSSAAFPLLMECYQLGFSDRYNAELKNVIKKLKALGVTTEQIVEAL